MFIHIIYAFSLRFDHHYSSRRMKVTDLTLREGDQAWATIKTALDMT